MVFTVQIWSSCDKISLPLKSWYVPSAAAATTKLATSDRSPSLKSSHPWPVAPARSGHSWLTIPSQVQLPQLRSGQPLIRYRRSRPNSAISNLKTAISRSEPPLTLIGPARVLVLCKKNPYFCWPKPRSKRFAWQPPPPFENPVA